MKQGFTLIELMLGFGISAFMLMILFQNLSMINRVTARAEDVIDIDSASAIVYNQLDRDLSGAYVPPFQQPKDTKEKAEDPFVATTKDGTFEVLTFITTNPLQVYPFAKNVTISPRLVRVAYILEPDKQKKGRYRLLRKESTELSYKKFNKVRGFELVRNITRFSLALRYSQTTTDPQKAGSQQRKVEQWPVKDTDKDEQPPAMPEYVTITLKLIDERSKQEHEYTFGFTLYGFNALSLKPTTTQPSPSTDQKATTTAAIAPGGKQPSLIQPGQQTGKPGAAGKSGVPVSFYEGFHAIIPKTSTEHVVAQRNNNKHPFDFDAIERMLRDAKHQMEGDQ